MCMTGTGWQPKAVAGMDPAHKDEFMRRVAEASHPARLGR
jgi:hypothetical protein